MSANIRSLPLAVPYWRWRGKSLLSQLASTLLLVLLCASTCGAIPHGEYQKHLGQAISALDSLAQFDEGETETDRSARVRETLNLLRTVVPATEVVEWDGASFQVDNSWLHQELDAYEKAAGAERIDSLARVTERLLSIEERLAEIEWARPIAATRADANKKLVEILARPEYARSAKPGSALSSLWRAFWQWLERLLPKQQPLEPGSAKLFTTFAQIFVILLALGLIAYVIKMFVPRLLQKGASKKKGKGQPRIVLGERLEPEQTAGDLLAEAETLARRGELRAAIRRAYLALLVELGERKIISLAQHKTNRDYLHSVREKEPLYANVKELTETFERHWYGFAGATEADWLAFRAGYKTVISDR